MPHALPGMQDSCQPPVLVHARNRGWQPAWASAPLSIEVLRGQLVPRVSTDLNTPT